MAPECAESGRAGDLGGAVATAAAAAAPAAAAPAAAGEGRGTCLQVNVYYRHLAWAYTITFFSTLAVAGIVTFTGTAYDSDTDKITLFYGMFNPCIWFDHYPAKVFATFGMGLFLLIGVAYSLLIFVSVVSEGRLLRIIWMGFVLAMVSVADFVFINVFTTNLYPQEDAGGLDSPFRRLHGVTTANHTSALTMIAEAGALTQTDIFTIKLHTIFYIVWIIAQAIFSLYLAILIRDRGTQWSKKTERIIIGLMCAFWYGMVMHATAMLVIILQPEPKVDWYLKEDLANSVQHLAILVDARTGTSGWGWVPIMLFRLFMPSTYGIRFTFSLQRPRNPCLFQDHGHVNPEVWVLRCLQLVSVIMALGGVFSHVWEIAEDTPLRLFLALREKPYAYFGAPTYLCASGIFLIGLSLQLVQMHLSQGSFPRRLAVSAAVLFIGMFGCIMYILDRADWVWLFFVAYQLAFVGWVAELSWYGGGKKRVGMAAIVYILAGVAIFVLTIITQFWLLHYAYLGWMCLYGFAVPDGARVYISSCIIEKCGDGDSAGGVAEVQDISA